MQAYILKSNIRTRFRFGEALGAVPEDRHNMQKTTSDYLHSDTLWSALVNVWAFVCSETVGCFIDECKMTTSKILQLSFKLNIKKIRFSFCLSLQARIYLIL